MNVHNPIGKPDDFVHSILGFTTNALTNVTEISKIVSEIFDMIREFFQLIIDSIVDLI